MTRQEIITYITTKYQTKPQYLWSRYPDYAVFKHENGKWFALLMGVDPANFGRDGQDKLDVVDLKIDPEFLEILRSKDYVFPGYHMNKRTWSSILIEDIKDEELVSLIKESYQRTK